MHPKVSIVWSRVNPSINRVGLTVVYYPLLDQGSCPMDGPKRSKPPLLPLLGYILTLRSGRTKHDMLYVNRFHGTPRPSINFVIICISHTYLFDHGLSRYTHTHLRKVGFYLPPDCLSRLPYSLRDLIASYPFLACSFSTFASSALNEQEDAGLPVDCGVLVLVDFAYLFLVLGQAALAQVESVAVGIYK